MAFRRPNLDNQAKLTLDKLPDDSISQITWSQTLDPLLLAAGSWDRTLRIWSFKNTPANDLTADLVCTFKQNEPILCSTFTNDSVKLFGGGCNNVVLVYDLKKQSPHGMLVARHDHAIMGVHWSPKFKLLMTCGWDGNVRAWDGRQQAPVWSENVGCKIFASDFKNNVLCIADSQKKVAAWNLENLQNPQNKIVMESTLKLKTKTISIFPELLGTKGVVCGSIGGRCAVNYFMEQDRKANFSYKCHRQDQPGRGTQTFPVNAIDFHDKYGTFITGGGDGTFTVWDKENKTKVKTFNNVNAPVVDIKVMGENNLLAYATSYDWERGFNRALMKKTIRSIGIIKLKEEDVKSKPKFVFLIMDERHNWIVNTRVLYDFISCIKLPQQPLCVDFTQTITHEESSPDVAYQQIACGLQYETKEDVSIYIIDVALPAEPLKEELRRYCKCLDYEGFPLPINTQLPMYQCVAQVSLKADVNRILSKTKDDNVFLAAKTTDGTGLTPNKYLVHLYNLKDLSQESKSLFWEIDADSGLEPVCKFEGHEDEGYGMAFNSGCSEIASCSEDGLMYIYDIKGLETPVHKCLEQSSSYSYKHPGGLNCIDYSKTNEKNCLVATEDGYVLIVDTRQAGSHLKTRKVEGAENSVSTTTLNPNVFASGSTKGAIHLWDQRILSDPLHAITVHKEPIVRLHFNQLNKSLISSGSEDLTICILDLDSPGKDVNGGELEEDEEEDDSPPELIFTHTGHQDKVYDFVWSKYTDNLIASVGEDYSLQLWQMNSQIMDYSSEDELPE